MSTAFNDFLTTRYTKYRNPLPAHESPRKDFPLGKDQEFLGKEVRFPLKSGNSLGATRTSSTEIITYNSAISATTVQALVTSPDMFQVDQVAWADVMSSMKAVSEGGNAPAYFKAIDWMIDNLMEGHDLNLDIDYMHGAGTGSTIADDLGVVATTAVLAGTGPNWNSATHPKVQFTAASWCEGIWANLKNGLFDVYAADGSTIRVTNLQCEGVTDPNLCQVQFTTTASSVVTTAAVTTGDRIVFKGAKGASIYGIGGLLRNTSTLFNVDPSTNPFWKSRSFAVGGPLTAAKMLAACTRLHAAGCREGVVARLNALSMNDLVTERDALVRIVDNPKSLEIGYDEIRFTSAAGPVRIVRDINQKQGQGYVYSKEVCKSVGSTEGPVLVGSDGRSEVLTKLAGQTGFYASTMSRCCPIFETPSHTLILTGIASSNQATSGS